MVAFRMSDLCSCWLSNRFVVIWFVMVLESSLPTVVFSFLRNLNEALDATRHLKLYQQCHCLALFLHFVLELRAIVEKVQFFQFMPLI